MTRALLDTDILLEIIKGQNVLVTTAASDYLAQHHRFTTSAASVAEITYGLRCLGNEEQIVRFEASLSSVEVLPLDDFAARLAGRINADLERAERPIGLPNVVIAAIAVRHGLPLVTGNVAHFERVRAAGYDLLIEDWRT